MPIKAPVEVIRKGAFAGTYFRDILMLLESGTERHGKNWIS